jgi:hypothetical protein
MTNHHNPQLWPFRGIPVGKKLGAFQSLRIFPHHGALSERRSGELTAPVTRRINEDQRLIRTILGGHRFLRYGWPTWVVVLASNGGFGDWILNDLSG